VGRQDGASNRYEWLSKQGSFGRIGWGEARGVEKVLSFAS
jgi:hypothetical protein